MTPAIYQEKRRMAHCYLKSERADHKLQGTALVNEGAPEIAEVLGISPATVERDWSSARIWPRREMIRVATP